MKEQPLEKVLLFSKAIQLVSAGILIAVGIVRFFLIKYYKEEPHAFSGFCLSLFVVVFGAMIVLVELSPPIPVRGRAWFYFLNFFWGKAFFALFVALFLLGGGASLRWLDRLLAVYFFLAAALFLALFILKRGPEEDSAVKALIQAMEDKVAVREKAAAAK